MSGMVPFDMILCIALLGLAVTSICSTDLLRSVILFIVFGLFMAIAWARLHASDIALTEAALGAGLTGALLLHALRIFRSASDHVSPPDQSPSDKEASS